MEVIDALRWCVVKLANDLETGEREWGREFFVAAVYALADQLEDEEDE